MNFDSRNALTVVFAGDHLLLEMLNDPMLKPLDSRIRVRFFLEPASHEELATLLRHSLEQAGNPQLMTPGLIKTVAEHSLGNHRSLMNVANELLMAGFVGERRQLDEKLYLETFSPPADRSRSKVDSKRRTDR
jgi:type II secretory pathway predicted ATPase ExeA